MIRNDYAGYRITDDDATPVPTLTTTPVDAQTFFSEYVSRRRPCVLNYLPRQDTAASDGVRGGITLSTLRRCAGDELVQVEKRLTNEDSFGKRRIDGVTQVTMPFRSFLDAMVGTGNEGESFYLSPQEGGTEEDEEDGLMTPCRQLMTEGLLEESIDIAGHMVRHACHLWMGKSVSGSSSGLHHDYHDNFYLLLSGKKRFRLFDPSAAAHMPLLGSVSRVYFNGRICYEGDEDCGADGIPFEEREFVELDDDDEEGDVVLGKGFDYESDGEEKEGFPDDEKDDFDDLFQKDAPDDDDNDNGESDDEEEVVLGKGFDYKSDDDDDEGFPDNDEDDFDEMFQNNADDNDDMEKKPPANHFALIPPKLLDDKTNLSKHYPDFYEHAKECIVELTAGQTLYIPAGWFHEVTSFSSSDAGTDWGDCHAAVNYWYHPPDLLDCFEFPYRNEEYWRRREVQE
mmetsp:Transcript_19535/g.24144  ORF Transcript_19535/g.24144 Transcript_19535/m.24144 type:complete len:455 (+) Transcript_19535:219-1583(+)